MRKLASVAILTVFFLFSSALQNLGKLTSLDEFISKAYAGGSLVLDESGVPSVWDNPDDILYHPENGSCASFSNADMIDKLNTDLGYWNDLTESSVDLDLVEGAIGVSDVDGSNYTDYFVGYDDAGNVYITGLDDDINPVLFDDDGAIIEAVAGTNGSLGILGFANPVNFSSDYSEILAGQAVINCRCLADNPNGACPFGITFVEADTDTTIVHEFGHFLNLDHSQVNADFLDDSDSTNDDDVPTMYPVAVNSAEQLTPQQDDIMALASMYPSDTFLSTVCEVHGTLLDSDGNPLRCADVQATTDDPADSVAFVSGAQAVATDNNADGDTVDSGECDSGCGDFKLYLQPNTAYTITVKPIDADFVVGSGIQPCVNEQSEDVVEEVIATVADTDCAAGETFTFPASIQTTSGSNSGGGGGVVNSSDPDGDNFVSSQACALYAGFGACPPQFGSLLLFACVVAFVFGFSKLKE